MDNQKETTNQLQSDLESVLGPMSIQMAKIDETSLDEILGNIGVIDQSSDSSNGDSLSKDKRLLH